MARKNNDNLKQNPPNEEQLSLENVVVLDEDLAARKTAGKDEKRPAKRKSAKTERHPEDEQLTLEEAVVLDEDLAAKKERDAQKRSSKSSTQKRSKSTTQKRGTTKRRSAPKSSTAKDSTSETDPMQIGVLPELDELLGNLPAFAPPLDADLNTEIDFSAEPASAAETAPAAEAAPVTETAPKAEAAPPEETAIPEAAPEVPKKRKTPEKKQASQKAKEKKAAGQKTTGQKAASEQKATKSGPAKRSTAKRTKSASASRPASEGKPTETDTPELKLEERTAAEIAEIAEVAKPVENHPVPEKAAEPENTAALENTAISESTKAPKHIAPEETASVSEPAPAAPPKHAQPKRSSSERPAHRSSKPAEPERRPQEQRTVGQPPAERRAPERRPAQETPAKRIVPTEERMPKERTVRMRGRRSSFTRETLLYSGESVATAVSRITREFGALILCMAILLGLFWIKDKAVEFYTGLDYSIVYDNIVTDEPVYAQVSAAPQLISSGYAAAQIVSTQMGGQMDTKKFTREPNETVFPNEVIDCLSDALPDNDVHMESSLSNRDLLIAIHESLAGNHPVIVLLGEPSGLHYGVVTAMDTDRNYVSVIDPASGVTGRYIIEDFLDATRLEAYLDMPFPVRLGLTLGSWSRNTAIFVD